MRLECLVCLIGTTCWHNFLQLCLRQQPNVQMYHTHFIDIFPLTTKIMCVDFFDMVCFVAAFDVNLLNLLFGLDPLDFDRLLKWYVRLAGVLGFVKAHLLAYTLNNKISTCKPKKTWRFGSNNLSLNVFCCLILSASKDFTFFRWDFWPSRPEAASLPKYLPVGGSTQIVLGLGGLKACDRFTLFKNRNWLDIWWLIYMGNHHEKPPNWGIFGETMHLGGGNSSIYLFSPRNFGEDEPILSIFFNLVVQPTTN